MSNGRTWTGRLARSAAPIVVLAAVAGLAGAGSAAAGTAGRGTQAAARAWTISTVAGGVGGPGLATTVSLGVGASVGYDSSGGLAFAHGNLYFAGGSAYFETGTQQILHAEGLLRQIGQRADRLTTLAGVGALHAPAGNGGLATQARLGPTSVAVDHVGNMVLSDFTTDTVRVVAAHTGTYYGQPMTAGHIYLVAGNGRFGFSGDGGPAVRAELAGPVAVALDAAGNLIVSDAGNYRVRVVCEHTGTFYGRPMIAGHIYTIAGDGGSGYSGDGGPAAKAELIPDGLAVDAVGNLVIADANDRIRVVAAQSGTFYGQPMTAGHIYTIAGDGANGFSGDGGQATAAELCGPAGVMVDPAGNVVIADRGNGRVRVVAAQSGTFYGQPMTAGDMYTIAGAQTCDNLGGFSGNGGQPLKAGLGYVLSVTLDAAGNLVIAASTSSSETEMALWVVAKTSGQFYQQEMTAKHIYRIAGTSQIGSSGDGGLPTQAELAAPRAVAESAQSDLAIADLDGLIRYVAARSGTFYGQPMTAGNVYTIAGNRRLGFGPPGTKAGLAAPKGVAMDAHGNVLIADTGNDRLRVVAIQSGTFYGQSMTAGHIYTIAGEGGLLGDGGPAIKASLCRPEGVAVDGAGNVVIADGCDDRVRVVAAQSGTFYGQSITAGDIYTIAGDGTRGSSGDGGPGPRATLDYPGGVGVDAAGNVVIPDTGNNRIRVVAIQSGTFYGMPMTAGNIYTIAGDGTRGFSGDGGPATSAKLAKPFGVAVDGVGNVVITDTGNDRIRVAAVQSGTFYGMPMTAGNIYTIAGDGTGGFSGDDGPATKAELLSPTGVVVGPDGAVMIADNANSRIREMSPGS